MGDFFWRFRGLNNQARRDAVETDAKVSRDEDVVSLGGFSSLSLVETPDRVSGSLTRSPLALTRICRSIFCGVNDRRNSEKLEPSW